MKQEERIDRINERLKKPIVIIGMMGAGKTTLAKKLSGGLGWPYVDSDQEIEADQRKSVKDIFETQGEPVFRRMEKFKIAELLFRSKEIISVGGGAVTDPETLADILSRSVCLWVEAPIGILVKRTSHQGVRPLLNGRDPREALEEKMQQRRHLYETAHIRINGAGNIDDVADNAIGQIYEYLIDKPL